MTRTLYIQLVPVQLNEGVDERTLLDVSDKFQTGFVARQKGVLKRILMRAKHGGYADLVFFESKEAADRVAEAEQSSHECSEFFKIFKAPDGSLPDMGILSFEHLKTYE
ncbi:MAG TPA: hypothetical protein VK465_13555 [Fibrobacteria bacterium]|nr:hypothetical protein [Fibrobacteria bacterium]